MQNDDAELLERDRREVSERYFASNTPEWSDEDRYLMDHPGPPKITTKQPPRRVRKYDMNSGRIVWDDEQFTGGTVEQWTPSAYVAPLLEKPVQWGDAERVIQDRVDPYGRRKTSGLWICRICLKKIAFWPSERAWRKDLYGLRITLIFRAPIACTDCRMFAQRAVQSLGHEDHRDFWTQVIQFWGLTPRRKISWLLRALRGKVRAFRG